MAENRYRSYLSGEPSSRFVQREYDAPDKGISLGQALLGVGLGALAAGGLAYSGALRKPIGMLSRAVGEYRGLHTSAFREGLSRWSGQATADFHHSARAILRGDFQGGIDRLGRSAQRFTTEVRDAHSRLKDQLSRVDRGIPSLFEESYTQSIREQRLVKDMASGYAKIGLTRDLIQYEKLSRQPRNVEALRAISSALDDIDARQFHSMGQQRWLGILKDKLGSQYQESAAREIWEDIISTRVHGFRSDQATDGLRTASVQAITSAKEQYERMFTQHTKRIRDDFFSRLMVDTQAEANLQRMTGLKHATVSDLQQKGMLQSTGIDLPGARRMGIDISNIHSKYGKMMADPGMLIDDAGELVDLRNLGRDAASVMNFMIDDIQLPIVKFNPLRLLQLHNFRQVGRMQGQRFFKRGEIQPYITGGATKDAMKLGTDLVRVGENLYDFATGEIMRDTRGQPLRGYVTTNRFGQIARATANMADETFRDIQEPEGITRKAVRRLQETLDIGFQETPSLFGRLKSGVSKFYDPSWHQNQARYLTDPRGVDDARVVYSFSELKNLLSRRTDPFADQVFTQVTDSPLYRQIYGDRTFDLQNPKGIMESLGMLIRDRTTRDAEAPGNLLSRQYRDDLLKLWNTYAQRPSSFLESPMQTSRIKQLVQKEIIAEMEDLGGSRINLFDVVDSVYGSSQVSLGAATKAKHTALSYIADDMDVVPLDKSSAKSITDYFTGSTGESIQARKALQSFVKQTSPWWKAGPLQEPIHKTLFTTDTGTYPDGLWVNRARGLPITDIKQLIGDINNQAKKDAAIGGMQDFLGQFTAGRRNMGDVTTTTFIPYFLAERLSSAVAPFGLGLSSKSLGNVTDVAKGLFAKRYLPVYAALAWGGGGALGYLNWEAGQLFGTRPTEVAAHGLKQAHMAYAHGTDATGVTSVAQRAREITPGSEVFWELPMVSWFDPTQSRDELEEYYESGYDPVRRGRYWPFGSTPFIGDSVTYYQPSWYKRATHDVMHTDAMYGPGEEHYSRTPFPTLRNPLAPVNYFSDPYYYEKKHYYDRPYPVAYGLPEIEDIPIVGSTLNATIGRLIRPKRYMHTEHLPPPYGTAEPQPAYGEPIVQGPTYARVTPAGQINLVHWAPGYGFDPTGEYAQYQPSTDELRAYVRRGQPVNAPSEVVYDHDIAHGTNVAKGNVAAVNEAIKSKAQSAAPAGYIRNVRTGDMEPYPVDTLPPDVSDPTDPRFLFGKTFYGAVRMAGVYGFGMSVPTGFPGLDTPVLESSTRAYGANRAFWDQQLGGLGGYLSEITRRFIPTRQGTIQQDYNPIPNTMPSWMPGPEYFEDFRTGDPYIKLHRGEMRLPGAGYELMHDVQLQGLDDPRIREGLAQGQINRFELYDDLSKLRILADVAPWSDQYRYFLDRVRKNPNLADEEAQEVREITRRVSDVKRRRRFFEYQFSNAQIDRETVTIETVLDNNTFTAKEYPDAAFRLAGIRVPTGKTNPLTAEASEKISRVIQPGARVRIGTARDEVRRMNNDVFNSVNTVVYDRAGRNLNRALIEQELGRERTSDDTPAGIHARYSTAERMIGSAWESFAHADTPLHTKFLPVRSALEDYKRRQVYGKDWQTWHKPIKDYLMPTLESFTSKGGVLPILLGAGFGAMFGRTPQAKLILAAIGATTMGALRTGRFVSEATTGERWIPKRRRLERDIEEYFDILEYVKYKGLYQHTRRLAEEVEGEDPADMFARIERSGSYRSRRRRYLERQKTELLRSGYSSRDEEVAKINKEINEISDYKALVELTPLQTQALQYKQGMEQTLYGADPYGNWQNFISALPHKYRDYATKFLQDATGEEREEILELVPENQRRHYQARWGMEPDERPSLEEYFRDRFLPSPSWEGWSPQKSLEDVKIKVARREGAELGEFNIWPEDVERAEENQAPALPMFKPNMKSSQLRRALEDALRGAGLEGVHVDMYETIEPGIDIDFDLYRDRSKEFEEYARRNAVGVL